MRIPFIVAALAVTVSSAAAAQSSAPCTTATARCEQWVTLGGGPARAMIYSSYPLNKTNTAVTRALILVHGTGRNADHYFETAMAAAFLDGALDNTVVISPYFASDTDKVQTNEVLWPNRGDSWRSGGMATSHPTLAAFDFMDEIVRELANKKNFPNLTKVVVAGHSAGGQFVSRYEMANKIHGTLGVAMSYVVANPSTYAWPSGVRPTSTGNADSTTANKEALGPNGMKVNTEFTYGPFDTTKVAAYNKWPAGLEKRSGYTAQMSDEQLKKQLIDRPTTYLFGQVDVLPLGGFDASPVAMAQGPTRRARGEAFVKYLTDSLGAKPSVMIVPECGHNDRCVFTTSEVLPVIFP